MILNKNKKVLKFDYSSLFNYSYYDHFGCTILFIHLVFTSHLHLQFFLIIEKFHDINSLWMYYKKNIYHTYTRFTKNI